MLICSLNSFSAVQNDSYIVAKDRTITLDVTHNDNLMLGCSNNLTHIVPHGGVYSTQQGGTLVYNSNNTVTYTPPFGFSGHDSFLYAESPNPAPTSNYCDTARVYLWVLGNTSCDPSYTPSYTYTVDQHNVLTVTSLGGSPASGGYLTQVLYVDGTYVPMSGTVTYNLNIHNFSQHIFGIEERWYNQATGDTCIYYTTDTINHPGCDSNYQVTYSSTSFAGDTMLIFVDTASKPVSNLGYSLQCNRMYVNGQLEVSCYRGNDFRANLSGLVNPVVCIEEWWNPIGWSDTCVFVKCDTITSTSTGIGELSKRDVISVFPNPVENILTVKLMQESNATDNLIVMNILGEILLDVKLNGLTTNIDVNTFDMGTYIYMLRSNDNILQTGKFVKK